VRYVNDSVQQFDEDGPAEFETLYGLPPQERPLLRVIPVPWDRTASFGRGTANAPERVLQASWQVDLHHPVYGDRIWRAGLTLDAADPRFAAWSQAEETPEVLNPIGRAIDAHVDERVTALLSAGHLPAVLGGEHSVALGAILAAHRAYPKLGVLHVDAHADLRDAYDGYERSHASIVFNALQALGPQNPVVSIGLRDLGRSELELASSDARVHAWLDVEVAAELLSGTTWAALVERMLAPLPHEVWITFDIDGLEPALCPNTGTPVPGGLSWHQAVYLLQAVARSGRRVVGFDLCEVGDDPWDANVGARLLYELAGCAITTHPGETP